MVYVYIPTSVLSAPHLSMQYGIDDYQLLSIRLAATPFASHTMYIQAMCSIWQISMASETSMMPSAFTSPYLTAL